MHWIQIQTSAFPSVIRIQLYYLLHCSVLKKLSGELCKRTRVNLYMHVWKDKKILQLVSFLQCLQFKEDDNLANSS